MNVYRGVEVQRHSFLPLALDGEGEKFHAVAPLAQGRNPVLQSPSGRFVKEKHLLPLVGFETNTVLSLVANIYYKQGHRIEYSTPDFQNIQLSSVIQHEKTQSVFRIRICSQCEYTVSCTEGLFRFQRQPFGQSPTNVDQKCPPGQNL